MTTFQEDCNTIGFTGPRVQIDLDGTLMLSHVFVVAEISRFVEHKVSELLGEPFVDFVQVSLQNNLIFINHDLVLWRGFNMHGPTSGW